MPVQTTYTTTHSELFAGMVNTFQPHNLVSKLNKGVNVLPYGKGLVSDGVDGAKLPESSSTADKFVGVAMYEINRAQKEGDVAGGVPKQELTACPFGVVAVKTLVTVTKDDPVYLRVGATNPGDFSNVVGSGATLGVLIPNAKFVTNGAANSIVQVSFGIGG